MWAQDQAKPKVPCVKVKQNLQFFGTNGNILFPKVWSYKSCAHTGTADAVLYMPITLMLVPVKLFLPVLFPTTAK